MTGNQYKAAIEELGMSQVAAAHFLKVSIRTSHGYAVGQHAVPEGTAKLLRLMIKLGLKPDDVK